MSLRMLELRNLRFLQTIAAFGVRQIGRANVVGHRQMLWG